MAEFDIENTKEINTENNLETAKKRVDAFGNLLSEIFHYLALFVIGACILWSATLSILEMAELGKVSMDDILLLFIYLELGAMVGIYFKNSLMPVRCLNFITITALCRLIIGDIQAHHQIDANILYVALAILVLALAGWVLQKQKNEN